MIVINKFLLHMNKLIDRFISSEAVSGLILIVMALVAIVLANSPLHEWYDSLVRSSFSISVNQWRISKPILIWVNDGLMTLFFLLIGLEIKREILEGQLASLSQITLPLIAALGGIAVPALLYTAFNYSDPNAMRGWAIPTATDIAFALGILALLGSRVPGGLKLFVMAVAIYDDLAAIIIIALFYSNDLSGISLGLASLAIVVLLVCNRLNISSLAIYLFIGFLLWLFVLESGVHATLAGVVLAFIIPLRIPNSTYSPLETLEGDLQPLVAYFILPLFAFSNAGVTFNNITGEDFLSPLTLGISLGLFLGKQIGIFFSSFIIIKMNLAKLPDNTSWLQFYGAAVICGIGFTMSLFIGTLAFGDNTLEIVNSRLGIFIGTLLSAIFGYIILRRAK